MFTNGWPGLVIDAHLSKGWELRVGRFTHYETDMQAVGWTFFSHDSTPSSAECGSEECEQVA